MYTVLLYCMHQQTKRAIRVESVIKVQYSWLTWTLHFTTKPPSCRECFKKNFIMCIQRLWSLLMHVVAQCWGFKIRYQSPLLGSYCCSFWRMYFENHQHAPDHSGAWPHKMVRLTLWNYAVYSVTNWQPQNYNVQSPTSNYQITKTPRERMFWKSPESIWSRPTFRSLYAD